MHQINMSEAMRHCLENCVKYAISRNAWISGYGYRELGQKEGEEITMEEALEFLKELGEEE